MTENDITKIAAQNDGNYRFTGEANITSVGATNPRVASAAQAILSVTTGALAVGAAAGFVDPGLVGIGAMSTVAGKGWRF